MIASRFPFHCASKTKKWLREAEVDWGEIWTRWRSRRRRRRRRGRRRGRRRRKGSSCSSLLLVPHGKMKFVTGCSTSIYAASRFLFQRGRQNPKRHFSTRTCKYRSCSHYRCEWRILAPNAFMKTTNNFTMKYFCKCFIPTSNYNRPW